MIDPVLFNKHIRMLTCPRQCGRMFGEAIAPMGFDTFACGELFLDETDRSAFYVIQWPDLWTRFYRESGMLDRDPIVSELATRRTAFTWSDLRADRKFPKAGRAAIDLAATFGWHEGLVVPMPQSGSRFGLVSMAGNEVVTPETRDLLALLSVCLYSHVRTLVAREGCALPPAGLTPREIECIRLVANGKSDQGIAIALGISVSTAHEFVEKAKRKLKAKSRAELIAVAVSLAFIDL